MGAWPSVAIVGGGLGGLCVAAHLKRAGFPAFSLYERAPSLGGTWRQNTYPGCACDVPIALYAYSFAPSLHWRHIFPRYDEMQEYCGIVVDQFGLSPHIHLNEGVARAEWDEAAALWRITRDSGAVENARALVVALGQLNRPQWPAIEGRESFAGPTMHSAAWDHAIRLEGKRVGVIGTAASAVQLIPEVAKEAGHLSVFQRSPNWLLPRNDRAISDVEKQILLGAHKVVELGAEQIYWNAELVFWQAFQYTELGRAFFTEQCMKHLEKQVADPELRRKLTPDYPVGVRRVLFCDDYYPALQLPHVDLVTDAIVRIVPEGVVTADGRTHACDVLVYSTGFETTQWNWSLDVIGRGGVRLKDAWAEGPEAYLGIMAAGFPNMFMTYGPNTNLGHNSITFMIERQTEYIVQALQGLGERGLSAMDVKPAVQAAFNDDLQARLAHTSWADPTAGSWYKNAKGKITQNWWGSCEDYRAAVRAVDWTAMETVPAAAAVAAE